MSGLLNALELVEINMQELYSGNVELVNHGAFSSR